MSPPASRGAPRPNADGSYTLAGLPPGTYRVDAGAGTETVVTLSVASTATLDLAERRHATAEPKRRCRKSSVTGRRLNEVRTSEVGTTVSQQQIETVPQMTRNFLEFADTVPGVVFEVDAKGTHLDPRRRAERERREPLHRRRRPEGLRALRRLAARPATRRAIRSRSSPSANTRSSPRTTRPSTTRSRAPRSPRITRSGTNEFEGEAFGTYTADNLRAQTPAEHAQRHQEPNRRARSTASRSAVRSSRTACTSS